MKSNRISFDNVILEKYSTLFFILKQLLTRRLYNLLYAIHLFSKHRPLCRSTWHQTVNNVSRIITFQQIPDASENFLLSITSWHLTCYTKILRITLQIWNVCNTSMHTYAIRNLKKCWLGYVLFKWRSFRRRYCFEVEGE